MRCLLPLVLVSLATAPMSDVLRVDPFGGGTHTDLQAAVDDAVDGDVILIRSVGTAYTHVEIVDKALTLSSDGPFTVLVIGGITVRNIAAGDTVTLINLDGRGTDSASVWPETDSHEGYGLLGRNIDGSLRVIGGEFEGGEGDGSACGEGKCAGHDNGWPGVRLDMVADAALTGITARGGRGAAGIVYYGWGGAGGAGVSAEGSAVALHDSHLFGGRGGYGGQRGGHGGDGLLLHGIEGYASGGSATGGDGGHADDFFFAVGGNGGHGVDVRLDATFAQIDPTLEGGGGGFSVIFPKLSGQPGEPIGGGGTWTDYPGASRSFDVAAPTESGEPVPMTFSGEPGDVAVGLLSFGPTQLAFPSFGGLMVVAAPSTILVGVLDGNGSLEIAPSITLPPGLPSLGISLQSAYIVPTTFDTFLADWGQALVVAP